MTREITCVNLLITTHCTMQCPNCCYGIPWRENKRHATWDEMLYAANFLRGLDRIQLTGGEPTAHPQFADWVPLLKNIFQCRRLTIETNGWGISRFPGTFRHFDEVLITRYAHPDNGPDIAFLQSYLGQAVKVHDIHVTHQDRHRRADGSCPRGASETVAYCDGVLYPCCAALGAEGAQGIPLSEHWRDEILQVPLPCRGCLFAEPLTP